MSSTKSGRLCTIFKGSREQELYVYVPSEKGQDNIPEELRQRMGEISEVMTIMIDAEKKLARASAQNVLASIEESGFFLQLPPEISLDVLNDGD